MQRRHVLRHPAASGGCHDNSVRGDFAALICGVRMAIEHAPAVARIRNQQLGTCQLQQVTGYGLVDMVGRGVCAPI